MKTSNPNKLLPIEAGCMKSETLTSGNNTYRGKTTTSMCTREDGLYEPGKAAYCPDHAAFNARCDLWRKSAGGVVLVCSKSGRALKKLELSHNQLWIDLHLLTPSDDGAKLIVPHRIAF